MRDIWTDMLLQGSKFNIKVNLRRCSFPSLRSSSPGRSVVESGKGRRSSLQLRLWNLNSPISANIKIHVPRVMTSSLMSSPPISISHRLLQCRYSNSRDVVASSRAPASFSRLAASLPRSHFLDVTQHSPKKNIPYLFD